MVLSARGNEESERLEALCCFTVCHFLLVASGKRNHLRQNVSRAENSLGWRFTENWVRCPTSQIIHIITAVTPHSLVAVGFRLYGWIEENFTSFHFTSLLVYCATSWDIPCTAVVVTYYDVRDDEKASGLVDTLITDWGRLFQHRTVRGTKLNFYRFVLAGGL